MPEVRVPVRPVSVRYICDEPDCGEQMIARDGFTNAVGTNWTHRCKNGHVKTDFGYNISYPHIEYVEEGS